MTTTSRLRLAVLLYLSTLAFAFLSGCARPVEGAPHTSSADTAAVHSDERFSVYDLGSSWRDQSGVERTLVGLRGKPVLLAMIYTHCTSVCPLSVSEMKRVEARHPDVRLVLVSLDPAKDSPARLADYAKERGLSPDRWLLLTGSESDVRDLAATIGIRYRRISADDLAHSNILTLLDRDGRVVRQGNGVIEDDAIAGVRASSR
jgi:protein SCO1/2